MKVALPLNGGINKDTNPLYLKEGEVLSRKNARVTSTRGGLEGINTSVKGMTQITGFPFDGTNKTIGYVEDKERDRALLFVYNSAGNHDIYLLSGTTISPLYADSEVLDFNTNEIIDADILGDYCVFVSEYHQPRKIDIGFNDDGSQKRLIGKDEFDILLAVRPPSDKPVVHLGSDSTRVVNKLVGKSFQFATMFFYNDYTYSVLSPYSDIVVSSSVFATDDNTYDNNAVGNYVSVAYDTGSSEVKTVRLLAREGNIGSWFIVDEYDVNGAGGTRTVDFYNDVARKGLSETEALQLYSDVPRLSRTVKTVQNRIALGNVLKGYDKTTPNVDYTVRYTEVKLDSTSDILESAEGIVDDSGIGTDTYSDYFVEFEIPATPVEGDIINITARGRYFQTHPVGEFGKEYFFLFMYNYEYVVQLGDTHASIKQDIVYDIQSKGTDIVTVAYGDAIPGLDFTVSAQADLITSGRVALLFVGVWNGLGQNKHEDGDGTYDSNIDYSSFSVTQGATGAATLKAGSYYNVGLLFYDDFNRTSGVLGQEKVYVPHAGERDYADAYKAASIDFEILSGTVVPSWAKYYRFALTESANFVGVYPFVIGNDTTENIRQIFLDGQSVIAINMPSNLQYEFAKGDYLQIEVDSGSAITNTITKSIIGTRTLLEIAGTEYPGFWLIVPKGGESVSTYDGNLAYIYRAKDQVQDLIYFESSETFDIVNGVMQTLTGTVGGEDAWFVKRKFEWEGASAPEIVIVEDFYINVDQAVRAYSKGRPVVEFDTLGEVRLQDFVWSFNYLDGTKINGISTFNSLNRKQLDEKDGEIQRIELVGDVVKVIQDNKETSLYVGKAQISDAEGIMQVIKSNDFIGAVNPSDNDYGSRYPLSIVQNNRDLYYWDGDEGQVIRSSPNGQIPVSAYGMKSEFLRIKDLSPSKVFAAFDKKNDEYVITFVVSGAPITYSFKEGANTWNAQWQYEKNNVAADMYGNIGSQLYSFGFGYGWQHETNSSNNVFYGQYKPLSVKGLVNMYPREEKCLRSLEIDSNRGIKCTIESPITNTRILGQKSYLYEATYRVRDGKYTSSVFKNILTTTGEDIYLIHEGEDMVGQYLTLEFTDAHTGECQLRLVTAGFTINK